MRSEQPSTWAARSAGFAVTWELTAHGRDIAHGAD